MKKSQLYPVLANWIKRHFDAFKGAGPIGTKLSRADVVGIRDAGGEFRATNVALDRITCEGAQMHDPKRVLTEFYNLCFEARCDFDLLCQPSSSTPIA